MRPWLRPFRTECCVLSDWPGTSETAATTTVLPDYYPEGYLSWSHKFSEERGSRECAWIICENSHHSLQQKSLEDEKNLNTLKASWAAASAAIRKKNEQETRDKDTVESMRRTYTKGGSSVSTFAGVLVLWREPWLMTTKMPAVAVEIEKSWVSSGRRGGDACFWCRTAGRFKFRAKRWPRGEARHRIPLLFLV